MSTHSQLTPAQQKESDKKYLVDKIEANYPSFTSALTKLNPRRQNLSNIIITECVRVILDRKYDDKHLIIALRLIQSFIYYITHYTSRLKDNIVNKELDSMQGLPAGIHDTLNALCDGLDKEPLPVPPLPSIAPVVRKLVEEDNRLPTQTGGQKIRKYRKMRTKSSSKSNIRTRRRRRRRSSS